MDEGVYKIIGDTLTFCLYQGKGKQRPIRFETIPEDPNTILGVFKKAKKE